MRQDDVSLAELRDAAKVIAEALSQLGRYFDPSRDEDLDRTVQYVSDLMASDPEKYEELVIALILPQAPPVKARGLVVHAPLGTAKTCPRGALWSGGNPRRAHAGRRVPDG